MTERDWADKETLRLAKIQFADDQKIAINAALRAAYNRGVEAGCDLTLEAIAAGRRALLIPEGK